MTASRNVEPLTKARMRARVAELLRQPAESIDDSENLIARGLESLGVMSLMSGWMRHGVRLDFADLIQSPTLGSWWSLAERAQQAPASGRAPAPIESNGADADELAPFELAPMQQAYWYGSQQGDGADGVHAHYYVELDGHDVDAASLERAVLAVIRRHAMLRASFLPDGRQQVLAESPWRGLTVHDLRESSPPQVEAGQAALRRALAHRRMDVARAEVIDVQLSLLPGRATRVHLNLEMLVADAQSFQIVLADLVKSYQGRERELPRIDYSFRRYQTEHSRQGTDAHQRAAGYWRDRIGALPGAIQLPMRRTPDGGAEAVAREHWIDPARRQALTARARTRGLTLPVVLAAAFAELLAAWSAEPRFLLNLPFFDRHDVHPSVSHLVGDFTNVLLLAVDCSDEASFEERARQVQGQLARDAAHAAYSGLEVMRDLGRARGGHGMLAPVVFTSVIGMGELFSEEVRECLGSPGWISSQTPQVWLDQQVIERDGGLSLNWDVVDGVLAPGAADAMFEAYVTLVAALADADAPWARSIPSLLPDSQAKARRAANATARPCTPGLLHAGFFARARATPDARALAWWPGGASPAGAMTYGELAAHALSIAGALVRAGVRPGDTVAITMSRGTAQVAAVLGALAAGATFLPVGVEQPLARRAAIYQELGARIVLTGADVEAALEWPDALPRIVVEPTRGEPGLPGPVALDPRAVAYVIATSGSTGTPKGVEMAHAAALNTVDDINERFAIGPADCGLMISALDFDLSIYDLFGTLSRGASLAVLGEAQRREPGDWLEIVARCGVTIWNSVPALFDMLATAAEARGSRALLSLRLVLLSGDWVDVDLARRLGALAPACRFVGLGGATEAAIWSNAFEVKRVADPAAPGHELPPACRFVPYGWPLANQEFRVVDGRDRDRPDWVPGELWIGGHGLAEGYRGDAARTAERFVERDGKRWYRTGDLGRYWPDGSIEFLGRTDHQIKIRGHRIELGEIEAAAEQHPAVTRAVALAIGPDRARLALAIVVAPGTSAAPTGDAVRTFVAARVPSYMVPETVTVVDGLALSSNGKVDREALRAAVDRERASAATPARELTPGTLEPDVARVWCEHLRVADVGPDQTFFELGGDSVTATRLLEGIRSRFRAEISHREFFLAPTVRDMARLLESARRNTEEGFV